MSCWSLIFTQTTVFTYFLNEIFFFSYMFHKVLTPLKYDVIYERPLKEILIGYGEGYGFKIIFKVRKLSFL